MSVKSDHVINDSKSHLEPELIDCGDLERAGDSITEGPTHRRTRTPSVVDGLWNKQAQIIPPQMTTKMKGLLKGLRYISQIFDNKEQEMQIGLPTDVKHVAHIGWDGPSINAPTWMNEFRTTPDFSSAPLSTVGGGKDMQCSGSSGGNQESAKDLPELPKPSRRHCSSGPLPRDGSEAPRPSRRHSNEEHSDAPRHPRRRQGSGASGGSSGSGGSGGGSPTKDAAGGSQHSRRRKSKGSSGGSVRSGRTKAHGSTLSDPNVKNGEPLPALTAIAEGEGN
ncbi:CRIB domain-containing protein RIC6-like isoform X2 [Aristolochia californica]|uniref:CRIB domain-containing protein RIC6-like isoform X2 n=1 Tax=Aristolochia californica TaxID=171875 RepID=UPI0035D56046